MTRINVIPPEDLTDQHLLAEYRELPRVFALARPNVATPKVYVLGEGHVKFFYPRTLWLARRQESLVRECMSRGIRVQYTEPHVPVSGCDEDWAPTPEAVRLNLSRLHERLSQKPSLYTHRKKPVEADFYSKALSA